MTKAMSKLPRPQPPVPNPSRAEKAILLVGGQLKRQLLRAITAIVVTSALGISPFSSFQAWGQRKPLPRPRLDKISFQPTGVRPRIGPTTRTYEEYKLEGTISRDARTGNFLLQWTGSDGKKKVIVYEPPVGVDAVVAATVEDRTASNIHR
jgi:hypothetical protein